MLHSFKELSKDNKYVNNTIKNEIHNYKCINNNNISNNNNNNNNVNEQNCKKIEISSLESDASTVHYGTKSNSTPLDSEVLGCVAPKLSSKTHEIRDRITNMHSSGVTTDSTAVIVNIGGNDNNNIDNKKQHNNNNNIIQKRNGNVRRTCSSAAYSEVAYHANRRERKISSSSSLTNQQQGIRNSPHGVRNSGTVRAQSTRQGKEQSPKFTDNSRNTSRKRYQREGSVEPTVNSRISKEQQTKHQQNQQQISNRSRHHSHGVESTGSSSTASSCNGSCSSDDGDSNTTTSSSGQPNLPYPGFPEVALKYLTQDTRPRSWCLKMITNPYPFLQTNKPKLFFSAKLSSIWKQI